MMLKVAIIMLIVVIIIAGIAIDMQLKEKQNINLLKDNKLDKKYRGHKTE